MPDKFSTVNWRRNRTKFFRYRTKSRKFFPRKRTYRRHTKYSVWRRRKKKLEENPTPESDLTISSDKNPFSFSNVGTHYPLFFKYGKREENIIEPENSETTEPSKQEFKPNIIIKNVNGSQDRNNRRR